MIFVKLFFRKSFQYYFISTYLYPKAWPILDSPPPTAGAVVETTGGNSTSTATALCAAFPIPLSATQ